MPDQLPATDPLSGQKPSWDPAHSYRWNYRRGPLNGKMPRHVENVDVVKPVELLGWQLRSPLGVAAGPLLNARFVKLYSQLGYSLLTYKTVRSRAWHAHKAPVLTRLRPGQPIDVRDPSPCIAGPSPDTELSCANSVGLPSPPPDEWREDVRLARATVGEGQVLAVSVVGTAQPDTAAAQLAEDFALCARWAAEAGADMVEVNLSCPNVHTGQGDVYLDPEMSGLVVQAVRAAIGNLPMSAKLGYYADVAVMNAVLSAMMPFVNAVTAINAIKHAVANQSGQPFFEGEGRELAGTGGDAIRPLAQASVRQVIEYCARQARYVAVIAVGGVTAPHHVDEYLSLGAAFTETATAAIWRPSLAEEYAAYHLS